MSELLTSDPTASAVTVSAPDTLPALPELPALPDGAHDFDFLHGRWRGRNRRLRERLVGSDEWEDSECTLDCRPLLGGLANVEEYRSTHLPDFVAMTVRVFDPKAKQWAIYWADNRYGTLDPPMRGAFHGDLGIFSGADFHQSRAILCRFHWHRGPAPRWEQAFSADGGQTWETNWTMDFTRVDE